MNTKFMELAKRESRKSTHEFPMGAVLVGKRPLARGFNTEKTHPKYANPVEHLGTSIHAEMACLIDASDTFFVHDTMYVYREDKQGNPALSRPCPNCQKELKARGITTVIYSIPHEPFYCKEEL